MFPDWLPPKGGRSGEIFLAFGIRSNFWSHLTDALAEKSKYIITTLVWRRRMPVPNNAAHKTWQGTADYLLRRRPASDKMESELPEQSRGTGRQGDQLRVPAKQLASVTSSAYAQALRWTCAGVCRLCPHPSTRFLHH